MIWSSTQTIIDIVYNTSLYLQYIYIYNNVAFEVSEANFKTVESEKSVRGNQVYLNI